MKTTNILLKICLGLLIASLPTPPLVGMHGDTHRKQADHQCMMLAEIINIIKDDSKSANDLATAIEEKRGHLDAHTFVNLVVKLSSSPAGRTASIETTSLLHIAVVNGTVEKLEILINKGADLEKTAFNGLTPLLAAIHLKKIHHVHCLLSYRSNIYAQEPKHKLTALGLALGINDINIIKEILGSPACRFNLTDKPDQLPPWKFNPNDIYCPMIGALIHCENLLSFPLDGSVNLAEFIDPRIANDGSRPLHFLAYLGRIDLIRHADANDPSGNSMLNDIGYAPIHSAIMAAIDSINIHDHIQPRFIKTIHLLLNLHPDSINYRTKLGHTPLHFACQYLDQQLREKTPEIKSKRLEIINLLLSYGADPEANIKLEDGREIAITPRLWARRLGLEAQLDEKIRFLADQKTIFQTLDADQEITRKRIDDEALRAFEQLSIDAKTNLHERSMERTF